MDYDDSYSRGGPRSSQPPAGPTAINPSFPWSSFQPFGDVREEDSQFKRTPSRQAKNWPQGRAPPDRRAAPIAPGSPSTNWRSAFVYMLVLFIICLAVAIAVGFLVPCQRAASQACTNTTEESPGPDTTTDSPDPGATTSRPCAPARCSTRGVLQPDGSCLCQPGWTGDFCENGPDPGTTTACPTQTSQTPAPNTPSPSTSSLETSTIADPTQTSMDPTQTSTVPLTTTDPGSQTTMDPTQTTMDRTQSSMDPTQTTIETPTCAPTRCCNRGELLGDGSCGCDVGWTGELCDSELATVTSTAASTPGMFTTTAAATSGAVTTETPITCPTVVTDTTQAVTTAAPTAPAPITQAVQGVPVSMTIAPDDVQYLTFTLNGVSDVLLQMLASLSPAAAVSVYGRVGDRPNFARYDVHQVLTAGEDTRLVDLGSGVWILGLYNGGTVDVEVDFTVSFLAAEVKCQDDCNSRGMCMAGRCSCIQGWMGPTCETIDRVPCVPSNCTEHGRQVGDTCECDPGWGGPLCEVQLCNPENCSGQGTCVEGACVCQPGWKGNGCDKVDCIPSDCNGNGACVVGSCVCNSQWQGDTCDTDLRLCPKDCSGHGECNNVTGSCNCTDEWTGPACDTLTCDDCSEFGTCTNGTCVCQDGYAGLDCREKLCLAICDMHGSCTDGVCICDMGFTGEDCTQDVCPRSCSGQGQCVAIPGSWRCQCQSGFEGTDCSIGTELDCDNGLDDDGDGLIDCNDPECCSTPACEDHPSCQTAPDPATMAPPANASATANFYDRISFLFDGNVTQMGAEPGVFSEERVCVLRGTVRTRGGEPHPGVKVFVNGKPEFGSTLSRTDGRYDLALNCGGRESLVFSKPQFLTAQRGVDTQIQSFQEVTPDVIIIPLDAKTTQVQSNATEIQEVEGSMVTDEDGTRQLVMFLKPNTTISIMTEDGTEVMLDTANVQVTEFTVGPSGEQTMPAPLPPTVAYTYAAELSLAELDVTDFTNTSSSIVFSQPVPFYVDDFLGFPVGTAVPVGYLDARTGQWVADRDGLVVEVLASSSSDMAGLDVTGTGVTATDSEMEKLSITEDELRNLKTRYPVGHRLWRVQITHMTPYDCNFPYGPPQGSCSPAECDKLPDPNEDPCSGPTGNESSKRRRKRSLGSARRRSKRSLVSNNSGSRQNSIDPKNGVRIIGTNLNPRMEIESWEGVYESGGSSDTCPIIGGTCGLMYTQDISVQSPTRMLLTIPGTELALVYNYFRQPGYKSVINIPMSGPGISEEVRQIHLEIQIAGVSETRTFSNRKNAVYNYVWNRLDAYGRMVQGTTTAKIRIGYEYGLVYYAARSDFDASFNRFSAADLSVRVSRPSQSAVFWIEKQIPVSGRTLPEVGLGGWTIANHHSYDVGTGTLYKGTGEQYTINAENVVRTVVGNGQNTGGTCQACGEGDATTVSITSPFALVESSTGAMYFADYVFIRKLEDGVVSTLVQMPSRTSGAGQFTFYMAINPVDDSILVSDTNTKKVYRVDTTGPRMGQLQTVAGTGEICYEWEANCGDGGLAINARFGALKGVAFGQDGNIFVVDGQRIRQIGNDGRISNYVGSNRPTPIRYNKLSDRYKQPFDQLRFLHPTKLVVDKEETMYIVDGNKVLRLTKEGTISIVAGMPDELLTGGYRRQNPTGRANEHEFDHPLTSVTLSSGGNLYIGESNLKDINRIHRVNSQENTITHVVGKDSPCQCGSYRCSCYGGEGVIPLEETIYAPSDVLFTRKGNLVIADQGNRRIRQTRFLSLNNVVQEREYIYPDQTQTELYVFDSRGYHVRTLNALTKSILVEFRYNEEMQLEAIVDSFNRTLRIERRSDGRLEAFVAPTGEKSYVTLGQDGMLRAMMDPSGVRTSFTYDSGGLVTSHNPPSGCLQSYDYSTYGRLTKIYRGQDIVQEFTKTSSADGGQITKATSLTGREHISKRTKSDSKLIQVTELGNTHETREENADALETSITKSNRVKIKTKLSPSGLWGAAAPVLSYFSLTMPSGASRVLKYADTASPASENPLAATSLRRDVTMNDQPLQTVEENYLEKSVSIFYRLGSSDVLYQKTYYDDDGRVVRVSRPFEGLEDQLLTHGSNVYVERQDTVWSESIFNDDGLLTKERGFTGLTIMYSYNTDDLLTSTTLPSGKTYSFEHDDCGNLKTFIMPSGTRHQLNTTSGYHKSEFSYSNDASTGSYVWKSSPDRELLQERNQDGNRIAHTYDEAYRVTSLQYDDYFITYSYDRGFDEPCLIRRYENNRMESEIRQVFDGSLLKRVSFTNELRSTLGIRIGFGFGGIGFFRGSDTEFEYEYDASFGLIEIKAKVLNANFVHNIERNEIGRITKFGNFEFIRRSDANIQIKDRNILTCVDEHNKVGFPTRYSCSIRGTQVFSYELTMKSNATVATQRSFKIGNEPEITQIYTYDDDGQLVTVKESGSVLESYTYDLNGNRLTWTSNGDSHTASYDLEDKIASVDGQMYQHTPSGYLMTSGRGDMYEYSSKGELTSASVDNSRIIYTYDGFNRLIIRRDIIRHDTIQFFYGNPENALLPSHVSRQNIVIGLIYDNQKKLIAIVKGNSVYYVMCDHNGTPLAVIDDTGLVIKRMKYDSFGVLLSDSNPSFYVPIGYAGGIRDEATGFVHYHFRDYMPFVGRWAARDPTYFSSGQPNLYQYVFNDPINFRDPLGLFCFGVTAYFGLGGGGSMCFDKNGFTICGEAGYGAGITGTIDPVGGPSTKKGLSTELGVEAGYSYKLPYGSGGDVVGSLKYNSENGGLLNPCAYSLGVNAGAGYLGRRYNYEGSVNLGNGKANHKGTITQSDFSLTNEGKLGGGAQAKGYGKACYTF